MAKKKIEEFETDKTKVIERVTEIEQWPITRPKPYKRNAKNHPADQIALLAKIIAKHGMDVPIVVDRKGVIVKGHGRWLACKELGLPTVPVIVRDYDSAQAAEARIADNRVGEFGWDFDALVADVVGNLKDGLDVDMIGFTLKSLGLERDGDAVSLISGGALLEGEAPAEFPKHDEESATTEHTCPKCGFEF